jgi:tetratricopeptide (TPR) repeat protein
MYSLAAFQLNNRGVLFLEAGQYSKAALCFKKASKVMRNAVFTQQLDPTTNTNTTTTTTTTEVTVQEATGPTLPLPGALDSSEEEERETTTLLEKEYSTSAGAGVPPPGICEAATSSARRPLECGEHADTDRPQKRQRQQEESKAPAGTPSPLGHALWMRPTADDAISQSATIIYNLALALQKDGQPLRALRVYEMARQLALKCRADHSPVLFVCLHNLKELYRDVGNSEMYAATSQEMVKLLRIFTHSYEVFYLRLLSVQTRDVAAMA